MTTAAVPSSGEPPIKVSFTITVDDVVAYVRLMQQRLNRIGVALGLAVMTVGGILGIVTLDAFTGLWTLAIGVLFVVLAGTEYLDRWRVQRGARSLIGSQASFTFDERGIDAHTVTGSGRVPWSALTELKRDARVIVIKRDRIPVVWIPTRAFASTDERAAVEEFIARHLGAQPSAADQVAD